jgi:hypothetical protein
MNALYDKGRNAFLEGGINWISDTIKAALVDLNYTPDLANDQFWSTPAAHVVGTPQVIGSAAAAAGVANGGAVTFTAVTGNQVKYLVIYKDTGTAGTSPLIACIDTATGLPVTPNGGNINVSWDTGANKILKL